MADPKPTPALYVTTKNENGFFHIYASAVLIDDRRDVRNAREFGPLYVDDLRVSSQGTNDWVKTDPASVQLYGWEVEFQPYSVTLGKAEKIVKTYRVINKRLDRLREQRGSAATYGEFVARVGEALGAKQMIFPGKRTGHDYASEMDQPDTRITTLAQGRAQIEYLEREWARKLTERPGAGVLVSSAGTV